MSRQPVPKPAKREKKAWKPLRQKRIKATGNITEQWLKFRAEYLATHPPDYKGEYECYICHRPVHYTEVTLDHKIPRSRAPELRFDPDNIGLAHGDCNTKKGSRILLVDGNMRALPD